MRVRFAPSARREFLDALDYVRAENPAAAARLLERAMADLSRLRDFPESGRIVPEFPSLLYREVIAAPYRFFYRIADDEVWIVAVWHGRQMPGEPE